MFTFFISYIQNNFGITIPENNQTYKEFCEVADADGSLAVDLAELSSFFDKHVNFGSKSVTGLKMVEGLTGSSGSSTVRVKMEVIEDFDEKDLTYNEERETSGILHKGDTREISIEDGQEVRFGRSVLSDVVIPLREDALDDLSFTIYNRNGNLYIVDQSTMLEPTRIKCELNVKYRINAQDYISLGLDQDIAIMVASAKKLPPVEPEKDLGNGKTYINIRSVPEGVSKKLTEQLLNEDSISSEPMLRLEYLNKDLKDQ